MEYKEIWLDVENFEGCYQVSNLGRVKSLQRTRRNKGGTRALVKEAVIKPKHNGKGYFRVSLCDGVKRLDEYIHRLVCQSFLPNPKNKRTVNHIDGDKSNNILSNLEWATQYENNTHAIKTGLVDQNGEKNHMSVLTDDLVNKIRETCGHLTHSEVALKYGLSYNLVRCFRTGDGWRHSFDPNIHFYKKGRRVQDGSKNSMSKLTENQVKEIKYGHKGLPQWKIGEIYGVKQTVVSNIRLGKTWKHI